MMRGAIAFVAGVLFSVGLAIAGMTRPSKVIGFLDVTGAWDPSLAFVMGGALAVAALAFVVAGRRPAPLLAERFDLPATKPIDARLLGGAAIFGVGWGVSGYCPGPAVASLATGGLGVVVFVGSMLVGMAVFAAIDRRPR